MFCSQCGEEASGNFCSSCGASLEASADIENWPEEVRYKVLIKVPEVRQTISRHAVRKRTRLSGDDFLELCDQLVPLPAGLTLGKLASVLQPIYADLGLETGKQQTGAFHQPPGEVIVAVLCSLAEQGYPLEEVRQFDDGCVLRATLPSDIWAFKGTLFVGIQHRSPETRVEATTRIEGQMFDWGKSNRCLKQLFQDLGRNLGSTAS